MPEKLNLVILGATNTSDFTNLPSLQFVSESKTLLDYQLEAFANYSTFTQFIGGEEFDKLRVNKHSINYIFNNRHVISGPISSLMLADFDEISHMFIVYGDVLFTEELINGMLGTQGDAVVALEHKKSDDNQLGSRHLIIEKNSEVVMPLTPSLSAGSSKFSGVMLLRTNAINFLNQKTKMIAENYGNQKLSELLPLVSSRGLAVSYVNTLGNVKEIRNSTDISQFMLTTKADTLNNLRRYLSASTILPQVTFTVSDWKTNSVDILEKITAMIRNGYLIVRSSSSSEDTFENAAAGVYESVADIDVSDVVAVTSAVEKVCQSYGEENANEQVLVQPQMTNVKVSGVVFTRSIRNLSPYYVVNYDDISGKTDTITSGQSGDYKTLFIHRKISGALFDKIGNLPCYLKRLFNAVREIEKIVHHSCLDIEFAITGDDQVYIFQVRPLTSNGANDYLELADLTQPILFNAMETFKHSSMGSKGALGCRSIYGVMPDWNPAEIIGTRPSNLTSSLYRYLIMDENWAIQRKEFGYRDLMGSPLLFMFAGQPYVDVRASINSFLPVALDDDLAKRLVEFALDRLEEKPYFHDKIEFNLLPTCYSFDFVDWELIYSEHFSVNELKKLKIELKTITADAISNVLSNRFCLNESTARYEQYINSNMSNLNKALSILYETKRNEILPFAHLARCAFIAVRFLTSAVEKNVISKRAMDQFMNSINTVSKQFISDGKKVLEGSLDRKSFIATYGHLRPGTYDITSKTYKEDVETYIEPAIKKGFVEAASNHSTDWECEKNELFIQMRKLGFNFSNEEIEAFLRASIEGREYSKFLFSHGLSLALDFLKNYSFELGISPSDLQLFSIEELRNKSIGNLAEKDGRGLEEIIQQRSGERIILEKIELPSLVIREYDFEFFHLIQTQPNFIGSKEITAQCILYKQGESQTSDTSFDKKIVCIPSADPGYDWIFGHSIAGLITQYGGGNSHMAIRAAEFDIPAVIGVGESKFGELSDDSLILIDCLNKKISRLS